MIQKSIPEQAERVDLPIDARIMLRHAKAESILLTLRSGEEIPRHTNVFDVLMIGIMGIATLTGQEEKISLASCETAFIPGNAERGLINESNDLVKIMVVKLF